MRPLFYKCNEADSLYDRQPFFVVPFVSGTFCIFVSVTNKQNDNDKRRKKTRVADGETSPHTFR